MTNELTKVELTNGDGFPRSFTVDAGTAITKGSLLKLTDPRTASQSNGASQAIAGIAAMAKDATDDVSTEITVWTDGIFVATASGAIAIGEPVKSGGGVDNEISSLGDARISASGAAIIGYSYEDVADGNTFQMRLRL